MSINSLIRNSRVRKIHTTYNTVNMATYNIVSFADGYFFGQKLMTVDRKLDIISDMLKVLAKKNVPTETFLQELNSIKGKLFDLDVNMVFLIQDIKYLSESELKKIKRKKRRTSETKWRENCFGI